MPDPLTADAILAMPAGAELDELVATRVLGWEYREYPEMLTPGRLYWLDGEDGLIRTGCPAMSDDLRWVGYVLDWLRGRWGAVRLVYRHGGSASIGPYNGANIVTADTLPLALCRAALLETIAKEGG